MMYDSCRDYLKANARNGYKIAKKLKGNDKEELLSVLDFLIYKAEEYNKILSMYEQATRYVVGEEKEKEIQEEYIARFHDDMMANCKWFREINGINEEDSNI